MSLKKAIAHFEKVDPILADVAKKYGESIPRRPVENRFEYLALTILYQQLAGKAADAIAKRFRALYSGKQFPSPKRVATTPKDILRSVGISNAKVRYILDLANKIQNKELQLSGLEILEDEEVIAELTKVVGIGRWTAEMFLMSALRRPDVFSLGDLGLQTAIKKAYGYKVLPSKRTIERISKKWSPYRTYAARVLWASLENN